MTTLQEEYKKEYNKLKRRAKRFDKAQIEYTLPKYPKKISRKSLEYIKKLKRENLFKIAKSAIDIETGEKVTKKKDIKTAYRKNQKIIKEQSKNNLSNEIDNFLDNWIEELESINAHKKKGDYDGYHLLKSWYYSSIRIFGRKDFGRKMIEAEQQGNIFDWKVVAYLQLAIEYINRINGLLPNTIDYDGEEMTKEEWMEHLEEYTDNIFEDF